MGGERLGVRPRTPHPARGEGALRFLEQVLEEEFFEWLCHHRGSVLSNDTRRGAHRGAVRAVPCGEWGVGESRAEGQPAAAAWLAA
ncbi:hypothetical protein JCM4814A_69120 [Streptomyces phaeofaciens JCM 4814]|uniref:Uncharacterized protein n=1 Tax=Streptomyces phaeofaciens TaxID=68254 RepID=A0A918H724_9ACTN|nr:hypothetical protein GCM10010226_17770 [Streptomyces phaeofaciens]